MTRLYRLGASGGDPNNALLRVVTAEGPTARLQRWGDPASSASKRKSRHNSSDVAGKLIREEGKFLHEFVAIWVPRPVPILEN
jgi:hypothetical protein